MKTQPKWPEPRRYWQQTFITALDPCSRGSESYFTVPTWPAAISRSSTRPRERSSSLVSSDV